MSIVNGEDEDYNSTKSGLDLKTALSKCYLVTESEKTFASNNFDRLSRKATRLN